MGGTVHEGAAHEFDAALAEPFLPGEKRRPILHPKRKMVQPQIPDGALIPGLEARERGLLAHVIY